MQRMMDAWGKYESPDCFHRLEHHCADVAACFEGLLRDPVLRSRFEGAAGDAGFCAVTEARLAVIAFLHDFGKLNAGFQFKVRENEALPSGRRPRKAGHIGEALLCCEQDDVCEALGLFDMCRDWGGEGFESLLLAALAHHGRPAKRSPPTGSGPPELWRPFAGYDPLATAGLLGDRIRAWFPKAFEKGPPLPDSPALAHLFAGVVALADQVGSNQELFEFESASDPNYIRRAREQAEDALRRTGFRRADRPARAKPPDFRSLFKHGEPRPLQRAVEEAPLDRPLMILESETGSGKTEAAIMRFAALWHAGLVDGLYFALPTRAAAKQIHARVHEALTGLFPSDEAAIETVLAVPGYLVAGTVRGWPEENFKVYWEDNRDDNEEVRQGRWAAEASRRFLAATAAVGTVDQALLAGLQVKWAHFRGAALARSLLVVDEAHASDAYMTELLDTVLRGHLALGGHALLMSATLGAVARAAFTSAERRLEPPGLAVAEETPYPAITVADGDGGSQTWKIDEAGRSKAVSIRIEPFIADPDRIAEAVLAEARKGAKVLVVRNTVASAQAVFDSLREQGGDALALRAGGGPALHHGRFAAEDRRLLDKAVERSLGKEGRKPGGCAVIGTQTLEQSLDIDADLLMSDLCPVDVLLQRIGRLHRHAETDRPEGFAVPRCVVLAPENGPEGLEEGLGGGLMRHGLGMSERGGGVYRDLLGIEQTRRLIVEHPTWTIPDMNRMLVERATHPDALCELAEALGGRWLAEEQRTYGLAAAERGQAQLHALDRSASFDENLMFPDLDEKVRTRLGEDGPRIVLAEPVAGPFGCPVQTFNLPRHLFGAVGALPSKEEIDAARAEAMPEGIILHVGNHAFLYDRQGIRGSRPDPGGTGRGHG